MFGHLADEEVGHAFGVGESGLRVERENVIDFTFGTQELTKGEEISS
jgi:hypothetical protein